MECQFCKNTFISKGSLTSHQNTAKYCLEIQGKNPKNILKCQGCRKEFGRKYELSRHIKICSSNNIVEEYVHKNNELQMENNELQTKNEDLHENVSKLEAQVKELQDQLASIAHYFIAVLNTH